MSDPLGCRMLAAHLRGSHLWFCVCLRLFCVCFVFVVCFLLFVICADHICGFVCCFAFVLRLFCVCFVFCCLFLLLLFAQWCGAFATRTSATSFPTRRAQNSGRRRLLWCVCVCVCVCIPSHGWHTCWIFFGLLDWFLCLHLHSKFPRLGSRFELNRLAPS